MGALGTVGGRANLSAEIRNLLCCGGNAGDGYDVEEDDGTSGGFQGAAAGRHSHGEGSAAFGRRGLITTGTVMPRLAKLDLLGVEVGGVVAVVEEFEFAAEGVHEEFGAAAVFRGAGAFAIDDDRLG